MPMCVIVTRDVVPGIRGFLASTLLEIAPGVYTGLVSMAVRKRIWTVLCDWHCQSKGSVVMAYKGEGGQLATCALGLPVRTVIDCDGVLLAKRE